MAGNEWINGYLEAILDAGARKFAGGSNTVRNTADVVPLVPSLRFSPTRYFVEEVINSFDEADLYKTWVKVVAMRNTKERNNRLENMCWRIWNLARKKKQIELEDARGLVKRRKEREQGRNDAADDISELSEGEKTGNGDSEKQKMSRINSDIQFWPDEEDGTNTRLYIVLISLHGLVRGENMELGRDSDTGGQVKYVVELARALAAMKGVHRVDLLTRQISDPDVDWSYGEPVEMLTRPSDLTGDGCGAYIIRIPCGPREKYVAKESLWPYIPEFIDRALAHVIDVGRALGDQNEGGGPVWPYVIHGHYADAGEVAARLAGALNVPMVLTGHSLGRNKFEQLLKQGRLSREDINSTYKIMRRIEAEELGLDAAEMVVTSTRQEIEEQWGLYDGFDPKLERKLRVRRRRGVSCLGRHMPRMVVIPPGMDFSYVNSQENLDGDVDLKALIGPDRTPKAWKKIPPIWSEVMRFFTNPHKPMILALSRPDPKKNVTTLIKAFGESQHLRELANMTLILGNRDDVEEMSGGGGIVLTAVLKLIDKYDLYGQVAYPKHHKQSEVPEIYRLAAKTKGVFINPALVEPFGLTLIEAAAYGLPVVATKNGGPVDILKALNNGLLIDPHDHKAISEALLKLVADKNLWQDCRKNGLKNIHRFSWPEHCKNYLSHVQHCRSRHPTTRLLAPARVQEEPMSDSLKEVEDLSIRFSVDVTTAGGDGKSIPGGGAGDVTASLLDALRMHHRQRATNGVKIGYSAGRRERLLVIAVDCYDAGGRISTGQLGAIVNRLMGVSGKSGGATGLVLSSGSTLHELVEALKECGAAATDFDALICNGGGEIYFPSTNMEADIDYAAHVEYRWPAEYVKLSVPKLAKMDSETAAAEAEADVLVVEEAACGHNSYGYSLKAGAEARKVDDMKQRLRMRGFRCNLIYTRAGTRLVILPLFASRAHALRYLWIRWGVELSKMVVFVGEKGDTDHEELLLGLHKAVILNGIVNVGSESLLRGEESYKRDDVVDQHSPNVAYVDDAFGEDEISNALQRLGFKC